MRYITRDEGVMAFGTKIGIEGVLHTMKNGTHLNDARFECIVDEMDASGNGWLVLGVFHPINVTDGKPDGNHTAILFGQEGRTPYTSFEEALAFCAAFGRSLYDKNIEIDWMSATVDARGMRSLQWQDDSSVAQMVTMNGCDFGDEFGTKVTVSGGDEDELDGEGDTCDVSINVPPNRVLH